MGLSENDDKIYEEIVNEYTPMVYKLSLHYSGCDAYLAEEVTQYTFVQLYGAMLEGTVIDNMSTFLHTILRRHLINCGKKISSTYLEDELDEWEENEHLQEKSAEDTYIETMEEKRTRLMAQIILDEIQRKNEIWYVISVEVFQKGRKQSEVAKELEMNDTTMYATVRRIRKWSNKHKARFEKSTNEALKEVSGGHLFCSDDEDTHIPKKKRVRSNRKL